MDKELWDAIQKAFEARGYVYYTGMGWRKDSHHVLQWRLEMFLGLDVVLEDIPRCLVNDMEGVAYWGLSGWDSSIKPILEDTLKCVQEGV